jgi:hypothetical protein
MEIEKEKLKEDIEQIITDGVIECEEVDITTEKVMKLIWPIIDYFQLNCQHPYNSVVDGNGKPERCLKCGKVLSA